MKTQIKHLAFLFCCIALATLFGGCSSELHNSTFSFANYDSEAVYVESVKTLVSAPPCGNLGPNDEPGRDQATAYMSPQKLPETLTITWWKGGSDTKNPKIETTKVDVPKSALDDRECELLFEYNGDGKWTIRDKKILNRDGRY